MAKKLKMYPKSINSPQNEISSRKNFLPIGNFVDFTARSKTSNVCGKFYPPSSFGVTDRKFLVALRSQLRGRIAWPRKFLGGIIWENKEAVVMDLPCLEEHVHNSTGVYSYRPIILTMSSLSGCSLVSTNRVIPDLRKQNISRSICADLRMIIFTGLAYILTSIQPT